MDTREIADRIALRELVERYARTVDDRDYARVDDVFAEDASLIGPGFELSGRASIRSGMAIVERYRATLHCVHNHLVEIHGNDAEGETYCVANHLHDVDGRPHKLDWGIRYQDRYRRGPEGWRITRRELRVVWRQDAPLNT